MAGLVYQPNHGRELTLAFLQLSRDASHLDESVRHADGYPSFDVFPEKFTISWLLPHEPSFILPLQANGWMLLNPSRCTARAVILSLGRLLGQEKKKAGPSTLGREDKLVGAGLVASVSSVVEKTASREMGDGAIDDVLTGDCIKHTSRLNSAQFSCSCSHRRYAGYTDVLQELWCGWTEIHFLKWA
ncbi:hypothetical protein VTI74DRAFT_736 [Chaetomium olivicolor]